MKNIIKNLISFLLISISSVALSSMDNDVDQGQSETNQVSGGVFKVKEDIPYKSNGDELGAVILKTVLFVLVLSGTALVIVLLYKRRGSAFFSNTGNARIEIIETKRLSQKTAAFLISVNGEEYLVTEIGTSGSIKKVSKTNSNSEGQ